MRVAAIAAALMFAGCASTEVRIQKQIVEVPCPGFELGVDCPDMVLPTGPRLRHFIAADADNRAIGKECQASIAAWRNSYRDCVRNLKRPKSE